MEWTEYPRVALVLLLVVTNLGLVVAMSTSTAAYGPYNTAWNGGTELRSTVESAGTATSLVTTSDTYATTAPDTVAFVVSPTERYQPSETARLRQFVSRGGTLLVASEQANTTNDLLAGLDIETRLNGTVVLDDQTNYRNATLPRATNVSSHPLVRNVDALTLNRGTVLDLPQRDGPITRPQEPTVLVRTSPVAYLDRNDNGTLDDDEPIRSYPVAAVEPVGSGRVVVVSDGSIFTNAMLERDGNAAFVRAVSQNATTALLDYSHRPPLAPLTYALLVVRSTPLAQAGIAFAVVGAIALWGRRLSLGFTWPFEDDATPTTDATLTDDDVATFVRERHPDWDDARIERVSQHIIRQRREP